MSRLRGFEKVYVGRLFSGCLKLRVLGAWMTFKKTEMAKNLKNGLSMIQTNPLNHNWLDFMILSGLTLHQFKKKLLLNQFINSYQVKYSLGHTFAIFWSSYQSAPNGPAICNKKAFGWNQKLTKGIFKLFLHTSKSQ